MDHGSGQQLCRMKRTRNLDGKSTFVMLDNKAESNNNSMKVYLAYPIISSQSGTNYKLHYITNLKNVSTNVQNYLFMLFYWCS